LRAEAAEAETASVDLTQMAASAPIEAKPETAEETDKPAASKPVEVAAPIKVGSSTELMEAVLGTAADAPLCFTCGTKMRRAGSCYVCEGCGSTSGCS
jgi:ribonucleoside-diphosphate reductase alpha chain